MTAREPLAALVARLRNGLAWAHEFDASGTNESPFQAGPIIENEDATRLLAAVEAGTKCAELLNSNQWEGWYASDDDLEACPECCQSRDDGHKPDCQLRAALDEWNRIVAPASHGSPEQGR